jgi:hypothetical protein
MWLSIIAQLAIFIFSFMYVFFCWGDPIRTYGDMLKVIAVSLLMAIGFSVAIIMFLYLVGFMLGFVGGFL